MNKHFMRAVSFILAVMLVFAAFTATASAAFAQRKSDSPCIFVPGIFGWGAEDRMYASSPYWGKSTDEGDLMNTLGKMGYECHAASVGPLSSAWDRACELYAQLAGTVVDYGAAHSVEYNHERFGRSYVGKAIIDNFGEDGVKINLFGHSFGGATARLFTYILANGAAEEVAATGDATSDFFKGGKGGMVNSVTALSAPHNGTVVANLLYDSKIAVVAISGAINIYSAFSKNPIMNFRLTQYKLTRGEDNKLIIPNPLECLKFSLSKDNCAYDLTLRGARELNESIGTVDGVYYFSAASCGTKSSSSGKYQVPGESIGGFNGITAWIIGHSAGLTVDGIKITDEWLPNDGMVPLASAQYPFGEKHEFLSDETTSFNSGVWYVLPTVENGHHGTFMGAGFDGYLDFYSAQLDRIFSAASVS